MNRNYKLDGVKFKNYNNMKVIIEIWFKKTRWILLDPRDHLFPPYNVATASEEILSVAFYPNLALGSVSIVPEPKVIPT